MPLTVEQFTQRLTSSGIMSADDLRDWIAAVPVEQRPSGGEALARELVKQKKLTKFQAELIYAGKEKSLTLGNYVILDKLGQGGMGMELKARHQRMGRVVALKVMSPAAVKAKDAVKRFYREVQTAANRRVHLAGVLDGKENRLSVNGKSAERRNFSSPFKVFPDPFMIGANPGATLIRLAAAPPPKLQSIGLHWPAGARLTAEELSAIARLPHLHTFTNAGGDPDDAAITALGNSSSLSVVGLGVCRVTQAGTTALQKTLANCRVGASKAEQNSALYGPAYRAAIRQLMARGFTVEVTTNTAGGMTWIKGDEPFPAGDIVFAEAVSGEPVVLEIADIKLMAQLSDLRIVGSGTLPPDGLRELLPLKNLTELGSPGSRLSDGEVALLSSFKKLHRVGLTVSNDQQLETIAQLPHLSWLDISVGSKITDNGLKVLESARVLSRVHLPDVSQTAAQSLANARPDVDVYWQNKLLPAIVPERQAVKSAK